MNARVVVEPLPENQQWTWGARPIRVTIQLRGEDIAAARALMVGSGLRESVFHRYIYQTGIDTLTDQMVGLRAA